MSEGSPIASVLVAGSERALFAAPRRVLDQRDIDLLAEVSLRLMSNPAAKALPDVVSFAFWCRRAHLRALAEERADLGCSIGRGLAFHVAPSNVPVNFAFSWAFSLLAGNACVVRVPSKSFPQVDLICDTADAAMREADDARTAFVSYDSASDTTAILSAMADVRVLWGGDATVSRIRALPSKPRCVDVAFADRYSVALIDSCAVGALDDAGLASLANNFYNDTYLMDQNACSSPMTVAWTGGDTAAKRRFWGSVRERAVQGYDLQGAVATGKYVQLCRDAMDGRLRESARFDGWLDVVRLNLADVADGSLDGYRGRGGYFYELDVSDFSDVAPLLGQSCQTVVYFGVDPRHVREQVLDAGQCGVDRIVPVGKAMDIDAIWDGMDLLAMMSRRVDVR
ncbi:MAG: hypothetical protein IJ111_09625 [Eggerthellaceae bacterium]|nr:hypothetical protein [Eggerthellaceae bacterium]